MTPEQITGQTEQHLRPAQVGQKMFLIHPDVISDLLALRRAAAQSGFDLHIASGFRSFQQQLSIWNQKFSGASPLLDADSHPLNTEQLTEQEKVFAILKWSALPGTSRHHWGCDFDIYDRAGQPPEVKLQLEPWEYITGYQAPFFLWMKTHMQQFGFMLPYDQDRGGVAVEPWHISHYRTASPFLSQLTPELMRQILQKEPIMGKIAIQKQLNTIYTQYVINTSHQA